MDAVKPLTLQQALDITYRDNWQHRRDKGACLMSQAQSAMYTITLVSGLGGLKVSDVTPTMVRGATSYWYARGLSPATITKRLNCLSVLGVRVEGLRPPEKTALKWWLRPEEEERAMRHLVNRHGDTFAAFIRWTTKTGLRIEESLRLQWSDIGAHFSDVTVPGLKTASSQATLPLGDAAKAALKPLYEAATEYDDNGCDVMVTPPSGPVFGLDYKELEADWRVLRDHMDWPPEATLKALRRSAARYLHVDCGMPLDLVRCYLRHEKIETTLGYLRLTGGYSDAEFRKYLK